MPDRPPPPYRFRVPSVYNRHVVLLVSFIIGLWSLAWAIGNFKEINDDKHEGFTRLATFATILGILYIVAAVIEFSGFAVILINNLALIRLFSLLNLLAALILIATSFMRVILHFLLHTELVDDCIKEATGQTVDFTWGIWGPHITETLSPADATSWCNDAFSGDSWREVLLLIATILVMGAFSALTWTFARGSSRLAPNNTAPAQGPTSNPYYVPPYAGDYAPPAGPPPPAALREPSDELPAYGGYGVGSGGVTKGYDDGVSKGFGGDVKDSKAGGHVEDEDEDPFSDFEERHRRG